MEKNGTAQPVIEVTYDPGGDILTFTLAESPQAGIAEEAGDEVWVRFDPETRRILTVDVHHVSQRLAQAFGPALIYTERSDPQRLEGLAGLFLPDQGG